jgi:homoserine O-succinyltransferase/O-acetyltransferase
MKDLACRLEGDTRLPHRVESRASGFPMRVAFVNNMPESSFGETQRQFESLLLPDPSHGAIQMSFYHIPSVPNDAAIAAAPVEYLDFRHLYADPPDALVITGTEPKLPLLSDEPYWDDLAELLLWAEAIVPSTLLSCLASHSAALALDGISRTPLPVKQSGVFWQDVDCAHPLGRELGQMVAFPHSRYNDIPASALTDRYHILIASPLSGWTVATRQSEGRVIVLLQGHPEYGRLTLLKEYRRDVRRFFDGIYPSLPAIPSNYFDPEGVQLLESFEARCSVESGISIADFPYQEAVEHVRSRWESSSRRLFANWVADAALRSALVTN